MFTREFEEAAVRRLLAGETMAALAQEFGLRRKSLYDFSCATDTPLYAALAETLRRRMPNIDVVPVILPGSSDSWVFRRHGLLAYGWSPFVLDEGELVRMHGHDERISLENIGSGVRAQTELLREVLGS